MNRTIGAVEGIHFDGLRLDFVAIQPNVKSFVRFNTGLETGVKQTELVVEAEVEMREIRELRPFDLVVPRVGQPSRLADDNPLQAVRCVDECLRLMDTRSERRQ